MPKLNSRSVKLVLTFVFATLSFTLCGQSIGRIQGSAVVCVNSTTRYTSSSGIGCMPNYWTLSGNNYVDHKFISQSFEVSTVDVKWLVPGVYTMNVDFKNYPNGNCQTSPGTFTVTVVPGGPGISLSTYALEFCEFDEVKLSVPGYSRPLLWYDQSNNFLGQNVENTIGKKTPGTYTYKAKVLNGEVCSGSGYAAADINVIVNTDCEEKINYTEAHGFKGTNQPVSSTRSYFGPDGKLLQTQGKGFTSNEIFTSQSVVDAKGRTELVTLPAPIDATQFRFIPRFIDNASGGISDYRHIGLPFAGTTRGTVGWYYSAQNDKEQNVPITAHPYSRTTYYNDGTNEVKLSAAPGEVMKLGSGHEILQGTFPVNNELDDYLLKRALAIEGIVQDGSLKHEGVQTVTRDQNGNYAIAIGDKEAKAVMTARAGTKKDFTLRVDNSVVAESNKTLSTFFPVAYFYLLTNQVVTVTPSQNATFRIENIISEQEFKPTTDAAANGEWPAGFYRLIATKGNVTLKYTNFYTDVAYSFYDDLGRIKTSLSPNGQLTLNARHNQVSTGENWFVGTGASMSSAVAEKLSVTFSKWWGQSTMVFTKYKVAAGTYNVSGDWTRNTVRSSEPFQLSYFLLDENLNVLDQKTANLNVGAQTISLSLTAASEVMYIGVRVNSVSYPNGDLNLMGVQVEGKLITGRNGVDFSLVDKTTNKHNFQGWLLETVEPDAGKSEFKYRYDGAIRFSQSALQKENELANVQGKGRFSYTNYDYLGRPIESGEYIGTAKVFSSLGSTDLEYKGYSTYATSERKDWSITSYDKEDVSFKNVWASHGYTQAFLSGAVSSVENANSKVWFSYDEFGRTVWTAQKPTQLNLLFVTTYTYDFLGNTLRVSNFTYDWSPTVAVTGIPINQFHHHYEYDADQRLSKASTSFQQDGTQKLRATYVYYLHGPLKRIELGDRLQGIDFVYNIQGWLTQINHPLKSQDPGHDANDAFGMILDYYESDIPNLLSGKTSPKNPLLHHGLPVEMMAGNSYKQPLPRFVPEVPATPAAEPALKKYSAENPVYNQMISTVNPSSAN